MEGYVKLSEATRLRDQRDLLELRLREVEGEKGRADSQVLASRNEIVALQGRLVRVEGRGGGGRGGEGRGGGGRGEEGRLVYVCVCVFVGV